jgi:aldehyde:ferredoxin oxidoreductase
MALHGYAGKILRLDLTNQRASTLETAAYRQWGGGHGLGSALFWDLCKDKTIRDGRHPANVCIIATSPFSGTPVPAGGGRCEVVGVGVGQDPFSWFTRSGFGGRFSTMLKYAGWDAVVIEGKADRPVWVEIRNRKVKFHDATPLWGKDTWSTQLEIWNLLGASRGVKSRWRDLNDSVDEAMAAATDQGRTTQKPAVLTIGPAGENQTCAGSLIHDAGNGAGQGGFGAVWGSKNLKAISVLGTGAIAVADPQALLRARLVMKEKYATDVDRPDFYGWTKIGGAPRPLFMTASPTEDRRTQSCQACMSGCRARFAVGYGNESTCQETAWYISAIRRVAKSAQEVSEINMKAADIVQKYGYNSFYFQTGLHWLEHLHEIGELGPGKRIPSDLPWAKYGTLEFAEALVHALSTRQDIGRDLAEGWVQAARKWGRAQDLHDGTLQFSYWGVAEHGYDPRAELEWGHGSILGDRDINEHCFNVIFTNVNAAFAYALPMRLEAGEVVRIISDKLTPYAKGRPEVLDFGDANMYSEAVAQLVRWHRHYTRFWKQSALLCDLKWPDFYNTNAPGYEGATATADAGEQVFWNAVTGDRLSFDDGIELGRRIWNLDNAIWTLQGRHRDMVHYAPYVYETKYEKGELFPFYMWPCRGEDGQWEYTDVMGRSLDRAKFEEWKTIFYRLEGWDTKTGWPTRTTLEQLGMRQVADALESAGRIGAEG